MSKKRKGSSGFRSGAPGVDGVVVIPRSILERAEALCLLELNAWRGVKDWADQRSCTYCGSLVADDQVVCVLCGMGERE